jgi:hypothetical protein
MHNQCNSSHRRPNPLFLASMKPQHCSSSICVTIAIVQRHHNSTATTLAVTYDPATLQIPWTVFVQSYSCSALVQKTPVSILVVLVSGVYALIMSARSALTTTLTWYYKRGYGDQGTRPFLLLAANQRSKLLRGLC